jgi:hypothetical protein
MNYVIGIGGLIGIYMLAFSIFSDHPIYPVWKRWALRLTAAALIIIFLIVHPVLWQVSGNDDDIQYCGSGPTAWEC